MEAGIGGAQLSNAGQLLGLSGAAGSSELGNAISKENSGSADFRISSVRYLGIYGTA